MIDPDAAAAAQPPAKTIRGRWHAKGRVPGTMNKTELAYATHLEGRRARGEILRWDFEPEKLKLAKATWYNPDFRVVAVDGCIEFHEIKGFAEQTGRTKIKVAAELHPYRFFQIKKVAIKDGTWAIEEI